MNVYGKQNQNIVDKSYINIENPLKKNFVSERCYLSPVNSRLKIIHLIMTRFMIGFWKKNDFQKKYMKIHIF